MLKTHGALAVLLCAAGLAACGGGRESRIGRAAQSSSLCQAGPPIEFSYSVGVERAQARSYQLVAFEMPAGAQRLAVGYRWADNAGPASTPLTQTVIDLGLWDADGYRNPSGFRGWSGSRQGKLHEGQEPVAVSVSAAERGYYPGPLEAGTWYVELGIAAVAPQGGRVEVVGQIQCDGATAAPARPDPVDAGHIARAGPGWYHGDFHMHGFHSNPAAPMPDQIVEQARAARLDFLMITDYVTGRHWQEWGATQRANPDLLIWPGREIITYFGHVNTHGETPEVLEYRHGFEDVRLGDIQRAAKAAGALFQVNHPTLFPGPVFANFCRGCEFTLADELDWSQVDTIEVLTGPILAQGSDLGLPLPGQIQNPFVQEAIDYWEERLHAGFAIAAVSGSDSKGLESSGAERSRAGYGSSATAVFAQELSRAGIRAALAAGRSYVRTRGVEASPRLEFTATAPDGQSVMFGGHLDADQASLRVRVEGGQGQVLRYLQNGVAILRVPITDAHFEHDLDVIRGPDEGPLGTFWRVETFDAQSLTTIGSPIYLRGAPASSATRD